MGCDIHAYAEMKRSFTDGQEAWYCVDNFQLNPQYIYAKSIGREIENEEECIVAISKIKEFLKHTVQRQELKIDNVL